MNCETVENHECASCNRNQIATAREKGRTYRLNNKSRKRLCKVKIDGCYVKEGRKCDYLIIDCEQNDFYFIELKGSHLLTAIEQIGQTISYFENNLDGTVYARIVSSRFSAPKSYANLKILHLKKRLKKLGGNLIIKSEQLEETI